jgi:hypothetical protein
MVTVYDMHQSSSSTGRGRGYDTRKLAASCNNFGVSRSSEVENFQTYSINIHRRQIQQHQLCFRPVEFLERSILSIALGSQL